MTATSELKTKKTTKKFLRSPKQQVYIHGPFRTIKDVDFWRVFIGTSIKDTSSKYNYKMFGPEERVRNMAQRIADDQKLNLAN